MRKTFLATVSSLLFVILLFSAPSATADVYVPPGPAYDMASWISPTLFVIDLQDGYPIGWVYSDGPMYVGTSMIPVPTALGIDVPGQTDLPKIHKGYPLCPWGIDRTVIPFSSWVMVFGFIPGVVVAPDQVPPPVEVVITWNGVPYVVTLTLPEDRVVGMEYPPIMYDDIEVPYAFTYPYDPEAPWKDAYYNIWVGDPNHVEDLPYDYPFGYYFWYTFHPNVGDWIAWDCQGETKHPPTYDITALFEYSTSQIWFNHVCFDVHLLHAHRNVDWANFPWPLGNQIVDELLVINVGKVKATQLDVFVTIPADLKVYLDPILPVKARITGDREIGPVPLNDFVFGAPYDLPPPFDELYPGETLTIMMKHDLINQIDWTGTLVFDSMVSAWEIPPWKYPRAMHSLEVVGQGGFTGVTVLWVGWKLLCMDYGQDLSYGNCVFTLVPEWPVLTPILRAPFPPQGTIEMTLDPDPVDLTGDGVIDAQDVTLVRQAIVGLIPYDIKMDINGNSKVDTFDLASYKLAAE